MKKELLLALLITSSLGLTACGGGGATTEVSTQTLGQELIDLKSAYEAGAMTESEYNKARDRLIESRE